MPAFNTVLLVTLFEFGKPETPLFQFVSASDEGRASYLAGNAADAMADRTGSIYDWSVVPIPYMSTTTGDHAHTSAAVIAAETARIAKSAENTRIKCQHSTLPNVYYIHKLADDWKCVNKSGTPCAFSMAGFRDAPALQYALLDARTPEAVLRACMDHGDVYLSGPNKGGSVYAYSIVP